MVATGSMPLQMGAAEIERPALPIVYEPGVLSLRFAGNDLDTASAQPLAWLETGLEIGLEMGGPSLNLAMAMISR